MTRALETESRLESRIISALTLALGHSVAVVDDVAQALDFVRMVRV